MPSLWAFKTSEIGDKFFSEPHSSSKTLLASDEFTIFVLISWLVIECCAHPGPQTKHMHNHTQREWEKKITI